VHEGFVWRYAKKIRLINPDIIFYGGDILEGDGENIPELESIIKSLASTYGSFAVTGNHDRVRNETNNFFTRSGIVLLRDSVLTVDSSFAIAGRNYSRGGSRKPARELLSRSPKGLPLIVLDHVPTEFDQISNAGADIVFSGHTHKGQMFPINLYLNKVYELSYGHKKKNSTHCFVSSGIRLWGPPVRTTGKSEIVVVDVTFRE
jgi:predicted MPP superfamily phosphohydrolase